MLEGDKLLSILNREKGGKGIFKQETGNRKQEILLTPYFNSCVAP